MHLRGETYAIGVLLFTPVLVLVGMLASGRTMWIWGYRLIFRRTDPIGYWKVIGGWTLLIAAAWTILGLVAFPGILRSGPG